MFNPKKLDLEEKFVIRGHLVAPESKMAEKETSSEKVLRLLIGWAMVDFLINILVTTPSKWLLPIFSSENR